MLPIFLTQTQINTAYNLSKLCNRQEPLYNAISSSVSFSNQHMWIVRITFLFDLFDVLALVKDSAI